MSTRTRAVVGVVAVFAVAFGGFTAAGALDVGHTALDRASVAPPHPQTDAPGVVVQQEFVPLAPCRVFDSRHSSAGRLNPGVSRQFHIAGTAGFMAQGGKEGGCGIPSGADAVVLSISSTQATGPGYLHMWAESASEPNSTVLNFTDLGNGGITTGATVPISSAGLVDAKVIAHSTHLVGDVTGYYREPIAASISSSGVLGTHSNHVLSAARGAGNPTGVYVVTFDQTVAGCVIEVSPATTGYVLVTAVVSGTSATIVGRAPSTGVLEDTPVAMTVTC